MRACLRPAIVILCLGLVPATTASAQFEDEAPPRSGAWVRAGLDLGVIRVDSAHSAGGGGMRLAGGWTLSPHFTVGARAVVRRDGGGAQASHALMLGPELAWYPAERSTLAVRAGLGLLDVRQRSEYLRAGGAAAPREESYGGLLAHLALTGGRRLGEHLVAQLGIEVGYAPFGRWRDTAPVPVTGQPWTAAFSVAFGVD